MSPTQLVAVVTGANKGIGKAIVKELASQFSNSFIAKCTGAQSFLIYSTSRDESQGQTALREVQAVAPSSAKIKLASLDITSSASIRSLAKSLEETHGTINILVNNAGMAFSGSDFNADIVKKTMACNYDGTKDMCAVFIPLLNEQCGRLVNVSSMLSKLSFIKNIQLAERWRAASSVSEVDGLVQDFIGAVATGGHTQKGWTENSYGISKMGVTALTRALALENDKPGVLFNCCCPGWVQTEMTKYKSNKTPGEGAQTPVLLALGGLSGRSGGFWESERVVQW